MKLEENLVEKPIIEKLVKLGWKYVAYEELKRISLEEPLLVENLKNKISEINKEKNLTESDIEQVVRKLQNTFYDQNGHREILRFYKYGVDIKSEEKVVKNVQLFDYKNISNNEFIVTNQFKFSGKRNIRLDILVFVNGIPLVNIECKNPYAFKTDYYEAYNQIKGYEKDAPELYKYIQIGIGFAEVVKYFPIVPWLDEVDQYVWRWEGYKKENEAIFELLKPYMLLDIIKNFIFIKEIKGKGATKVIARYMQVRAVNKIFARVMDNLSGKTDKNKGLIWHWQGSGKTLTMIFAAHKLYFELGKPTIFFIVDRRDLERQFCENELSSLDLNFSYEKVESIPKLVEIIKYDNYSGKRGVFITLIHKFNLDEEFLLNEVLNKNLEISRRKDIICFLDEVHRSQYGLLASKMKNVLKNSFFFGFTGTPIDEKERNTYREFGYPIEDKKELYLDRYFIDEAIRDGYVLNIVYWPRREKDINLPKKDLEWFIKQVDFDDATDEYEQTLIKEKVKKRLDYINVILEDEKRIEKICKDLSGHFKEHFDGKFKGLIVTGSRLACVRYKKIIDKFLLPDYTEVVMTYTANETKQEINNYRQQIVNRYQINDINEINKQVVEKFRYEETPKLLIVVDMLITGFDEPKLAVVYLDKLLKRHRLLQAIARTNRPYRGVKAAGLVVDYIGIFKYWKEALKYYKIKNIKKGIINKKKMLDEFVKIIQELKKLFGNMVGKFDKDSFDKALEILEFDEEKEKFFVEKFKTLRNIFELLGSDEKKVMYLLEYKWFACLYDIYIKLTKPTVREDVVEKYLTKTLNIIHQITEIQEISSLSPPFIFTVDYLEKIRKSELSERQKAIGIAHGLDTIIKIHGHNPIYKEIADKVKQLIEDWKKNIIDYKKLFKEGIAIVEYIKKIEEEKKKYNEVEFGIKILLENNLKIKEEKSLEFAHHLYERIKDSFTIHWKENKAIVGDVERKIREFLVDLKSELGFEYELIDKIYNEIFDFLYNYDFKTS